jgi:hypothetical protein
LAGVDAWRAADGAMAASKNAQIHEAESVRTAATV